ncbi:MAG: CHAT domain-containing protein [Calditrichia bacterium]
MCKHTYTSDSGKESHSMGNQCPHPEYYKKGHATAISESVDGLVPVLPIDSNGVCLFHSKDVIWKRKNGFKQIFLQLVQFLNNDSILKCCDFREFVFVGDELTIKNNIEDYVLQITNTVFQKPVYFTGASFIDSFELNDVSFQDGATFRSTTFTQDLQIINTRFFGLEFSNTTFMQIAYFIKVEFLSYALFINNRFTGKTGVYTVKFVDSCFRGITDFSGSAFTLGGESTVGFIKVQFEDFTDFGRTQFHCQVIFNEVSFAFNTEFIDTSFETVSSSARYRGAAVEFKQIEVMKNVILTFKSTDPQKRLFSHNVQFSFKEKLDGIIRFENVNFSHIDSASKDRLVRLAKSGNVEIGTGCIKYRFQTDIRTVAVSHDNAPLVLELCQTFTNYFTVSNGLNLGFEIVARDEAKVSFFYFTDENISEATFHARLAHTEQSLWNLLRYRSDEQLKALEAASATAKPSIRENAIINAVDGISALLGTFFRVGMRIALGTWKEADTKALLGAVQFNSDGAENRALSLHRVFTENYTATTLLDINRQQNRLLSPMVMDSRYMDTPKKVKILFLGANSSSSPLGLDLEVKQLQTNLKLAKERDTLEFSQEWAITVDSLMQAMLDESPTIVHFSGHGNESGIILQDGMGEPKVVSTDALSNMFKLFKDRLQCVVLNSCYSKPQAQAIRMHIPHVIGMSSSIPDPAAIAFSTGFYKAVGAGKDIPFAFDLGKAAIQLEGISGENIPVLL